LDYGFCSVYNQVIVWGVIYMISCCMHIDKIMMMWPFFNHCWS